VLLGKYFFRVIVPWSLAVVIYGGLVGRGGFWSAAGIVKSFLFPYYHLWFIPAFLGWIILTWILLKLKIRNSWLLLISFLVSVGFYAIDKVPGWYMENGHARAILQFVLATLRPYYFFFFVLGLVLRKTLLPKPSFIEYFICALLFGVIVHLFFARKPVLSFIIFFLLNTVLLTLILKISVKNLAGKNSLLEWIGVNSMGIYLWHMIPILIAKSYKNTPAEFYLHAIVLQAAFLAAYYYLNKIAFIRKFFFGGTLR